MQSRTPEKGDRVVVVSPTASAFAIVTGRWEPRGGPHLTPRAISAELETGASIDVIAHRDQRPFPDACYWVWPEELT